MKVNSANYVSHTFFLFLSPAAECSGEVTVWKPYSQVDFFAKNIFCTAGRLTGCDIISCKPRSLGWLCVDTWLNVHSWCSVISDKCLSTHCWSSFTVGYKSRQVWPTIYTMGKAARVFVQLWECSVAVLRACCPRGYARSPRCVPWERLHKWAPCSFPRSCFAACRALSLFPGHAAMKTCTSSWACFSFTCLPSPSGYAVKDLTHRVKYEYLECFSSVLLVEK